MNRRSLLWVLLTLLVASYMYYYYGYKGKVIQLVSDTGLITSVDFPSKSITVKNINNEELVMICNKKTTFLDDKEQPIEFESLLPSMHIKYDGYRSKTNEDLVIILTSIQLTDVSDILLLSPTSSSPIKNFPIVLRGYVRTDTHQTYKLYINGFDQGFIQPIKSDSSNVYQMFEHSVALNREMLRSLEPVIEIKIQPSGEGKAFTRQFNLELMKKIELYFGNSKMDPQSEDCTAVFPVTREILILANPSDILHLLIQGPSASEKEKGYYSSLPFGASINSIEKKDKQISVDFKSLHAGGACQIDGILSEISHTLISAYPGFIITVTENGSILSP
ncbi:GerMN domain-containing protein [bacterium]|nr:GerMN domain-containing protein [bacterium]